MFQSTAVWENQSNVDLLKAMWLEGASASEIANAIGQGITRNAVIGKVTRMKLQKRTKHAAAVQSAHASGRGRGNPGQARVGGIVARAESRQRSVARAELQHADHRPFRAGSLPPEDVGIDLTQLLGLSDRRIGKQCSWIHGDPLQAGSGFCGKSTVNGTEWCQHHHDRVYPKRD